jgi:hypothetical protein
VKKKKCIKYINKPVKAAKMYFSGMKPGTICSNLSLNSDTFWDYVYNFQLEEAIKMKINGIAEDEICKKLKLEKGIFKCNPLKIHFNESAINTTQSGRTEFITNICKESGILH